MKVIELTNEFSMGNGISDVIRTISEGLKENNYDVEIWYKYHLREVPDTKAKLVKKSYFQILKDLLKIKEKTVIHTHFGRTFFIGSLARLINKRLIHLHTEYINTPYEASGGKKTQYYLVDFLHKLSYLYGKTIDHAVGISNYACREILRYGVPNKLVSLIYLGIDNNKKQIKKVNKIINFGSLARFSKSKNLKFILEKRDSFPNQSKLFVAGAIDVLDKNYYAYCQKLANGKNNTWIFPNLPRKEWSKFYSKFDVFLYPSMWEGFGLPLIEAMSYGKPVICFNKYAMPEIVKNNYNGFVVSNEQEFFQKINYLFRNPNVVKKMIQNSLKESKKYLKKNMIHKYIKIIDQLAKI